MAILLMDIGGYSIVVIGGYWWLLMAILLMDIGGYFIVAIVVILLMVLGGYFINDYWWLLY